MMTDRFVKWVEAEEERICYLADKKIRLRKQAAIDEDDYTLLTEFVKEVEDLERLKKDFLNHKPDPEKDDRIGDYLSWYITYGEEIEKF